ncbi:MAG: hypothetical protein H7122_14735 [Chitinophagaceae bacterium]|nr:hypothetical protein [Chitinophagaceae bacterium]
MMDDRKDNSPHILNTSSTLLGLCFIVLTSLKVTNRTEATIIDELTAVAILMFMTSSFLSFQSMRSQKTPSVLYEKIADFIFLAGLFFLFVTTVLIIFNIIK